MKCCKISNYDYRYSIRHLRNGKNLTCHVTLTDLDERGAALTDWGGLDGAKKEIKKFYKYKFAGFFNV